MIRLIQRRLIIPRGDTGSFSIPALSKGGTNNIAVFTIFDETTRTKMFQKIISGEGDVLTIAFTHSDTVNLKPGKYVWDIKYYKNPEYIDDELVNGEEINSYYAGFSLPVCEIRETADNYLVSPEAPTATLSPEQLEIVTGAIHSLNEAIRKTQENVEHYPEIRDEVWYAWDAELGDYVNTGVRANGIVGNGIASAVLNDDYTLTLNFTDGTSFTSTSIRGETGNGIDDIVLNNDFTLTISYTDGESYTTPSIRGPVGATPQFSIGTVQDGAVAAASITGTAENPVLNLTLPNAHVPTRVSQLENDSNYAVDANYVHTDNNYTTTEKDKLSGIAAGAEVNVNADWNATSGDAQILNKPTRLSAFLNDEGYLIVETDPTVPAWAKAATKPTYTAAEVGAPTVTEMNTAIREAIGQINSFDIAVVQALPTQDISMHTIYLVPKTGETNDVYDEYIYINSKWEMVGNTQIDLSDYALKSELPTKVSELSNDSGYLTSYEETDPTVPQWAKASTKPSYTATEVGALPNNTHIPTTTAELTNDAGFITSADLPTKISDLTNDAGYLTQHQDISGKANSADLATVATSGSYNDLNNKPSIPTKISDLTDDSGHYTKPVTGIPATDLASDVQTSLGKADTALQSAPVTSVNTKTGAVVLTPGDIGAGTYSKPSGGIPKTDLTSDVQTSLGKADTALQSAPVTSVNAKTGAVMLTPSDIGAGTYSKPSGGIPASDLANGVIPIVPVQDVQVAGVSVLSGGVANVPIASAADVKAGADANKLITPTAQQLVAFYGLAKAAGDTTQSASSNEVGQYTDEAKLAIRSMLGAASEPAVAAKYTKPSTGIPASDLTSAVQTSLGKADTALQSAPVTSVNGSTGAVVLSIPSTAADVGAIAAPASPATGAFLVWSGNAWTAQTLATWEGGSF